MMPRHNLDNPCGVLAHSRNSSQTRARAATHPLIDLFNALPEGDVERENCEMSLLVRKLALTTSVALAAITAAENADARPLRHRAAPVDYSVADPRYQHHIIPQVIGRDTKGDMLYHHRWRT
jgi:hypothetical protein